MERKWRKANQIQIDVLFNDEDDLNLFFEDILNLVQSDKYKIRVTANGIVDITEEYKKQKLNNQIGSIVM